MFNKYNSDSIIETIKIFNITVLLGLILYALNLLPNTGFIAGFLVVSLLGNASYANYIEKHKLDK